MCEWLGHQKQRQLRMSLSKVNQSMMSMFMHTGELDVYHALITRYASVVNCDLHTYGELYITIGQYRFTL